MKYLVPALFILLFAAACNSKEGQTKNDTNKPTIPYYKVSDIQRAGYLGRIKQITDTMYDYVEKKDRQWITPTPENYSVRISKFDSAGYQYTLETFSISNDEETPEQYRNYHKITTIFSRVNDTLVVYGLLHQFASKVTDTLLISYVKPAGPLSNILTMYDFDKKTKQWKLRETETTYMDKDYHTIKTITSYPNNAVSDTTPYIPIVDRTNEADTNNTKVILAKDSTGNTILMLDRQDPERKQLHRIGYTYYK